MLVQVADHVAQLEGKRLGEPINITLHGQEKNLGTWAIAKMNLLLMDCVMPGLRRATPFVIPVCSIRTATSFSMIV